MAKDMTPEELAEQYGRKRFDKKGTTYQRESYKRFLSDLTSVIRGQLMEFAEWYVKNEGYPICVSGSTLIREHCRFKDAPCNYTGKGWYDRCAWCKDNNGFRDKNEDTTKPF